MDTKAKEEKSLADVVADNIKNNPTDWTERKDTTGEFWSHYKSEYFEFVLENKRCGIKLKSFHTGRMGQSLLMTSPDSMHFGENDIKKIFNAWDDAIAKPQEEAERKAAIHRRDSIENNIKAKILNCPK